MHLRLQFRYTTQVCRTVSRVGPRPAPHPERSAQAGSQTVPHTRPIPRCMPIRLQHPRRVGKCQLSAELASTQQALSTSDPMVNASIPVGPASTLLQAV